MISQAHAAPPQLEPSQLKVVVAGSVIIQHLGVGRQLFRFTDFSGPDLRDNANTLVGVSYSLVLDACRVLTNHAANNHCDFLAEDSEGKIPVPFDDVEPLSPGVYFYFPGPPSDPTNLRYPIVTKFSAFVFPPPIPDNWYATRRSVQLTGGQVGIVSSTNMSVLCPCHVEGPILRRDKVSALPRQRGCGCQCAYKRHFIRRDDVHRALNSHAFVFYPAGNDQFMTYCVQAMGFPDYYTELLHRRLVTIHPSVAVEFLYARFAYTVIHLYRPNKFFDSVPDNPTVKMLEEKLASSEAEKQARKAASVDEYTSTS